MIVKSKLHLMGGGLHGFHVDVHFSFANGTNMIATIASAKTATNALELGRVALKRLRKQLTVLEDRVERQKERVRKAKKAQAKAKRKGKAKRG